MSVCFCWSIHKILFHLQPAGGSAPTEPSDHLPKGPLDGTTSELNKEPHGRQVVVGEIIYLDVPVGRVWVRINQSLGSMGYCG